MPAKPYPGLAFLPDANAPQTTFGLQSMQVRNLADEVGPMFSMFPSNGYSCKDSFERRSIHLKSAVIQDNVIVVG
jgi:hypothetical protein